MPVAGTATKPLLIRPKDEGGCWQWAGPIGEAGYGHKTFNGEQMVAHRWIWITFFGPITDGYVVFAKCGTRGCCNPWHLRMGTQADAVRNSTTATLLPEDVREIKRAKADKGPNTATVLASKYGVSPGLVRDIWRGAAWGHAKKFRGPRKPRNQFSGVACG